MLAAVFLSLPAVLSSLSATLIPSPEGPTAPARARKILVDGVSYAGGMTSDSDDALSWEGDDDTASHRTGRPRRRENAAPPVEPPLHDATTTESAAVAPTTRPPASPPPTEAAPPSAPAASVAADDDEAPAGLSNAMLLLVGVVGGVYLLYSVGWVVGGLRLQPLASFLVADAMFLPWFVLAIAAPALWFLATWVLTRGRAAWVRVALLLAGVVLLVPWPFVTVGVVGS